MVEIDLKDTKIAFQSRSTPQLKKSYYLFKSFDFPRLARTGPRLLSWALDHKIPITPIIRHTLFPQFCGGESITDCQSTIDQLARFAIGTILDYSAEGQGTEASFDNCAAEITKIIHFAKGKTNIPFVVFKPTGIMPFSILEKVHHDLPLSDKEEQRWQKAQGRFAALCRAAKKADIPILVDAEETWIQGPIDQLTLEMMHKFNEEKAIVFTTIQFYLKGSLDHLKKLHHHTKEWGVKLGVKAVRGAYMEKERARAQGKISPIHENKRSTDRAFDEGLDYCLNHLEDISLCVGTHNESSVSRMTRAMKASGTKASDPRIVFSQLYGMGDHISYNLAHHGYNVTKYIPYGPIEHVMPYLFRRAEENSSVSGQASRELTLLKTELRRRSSEKAFIQKDS
jgi:proline dehydrogenase